MNYRAKTQKLKFDPVVQKYEYVYNGWNVIAVYDANNALQKSYLWGIDISGTLQGAGGVGGLLTENSNSTSYYPAYDGNGNIRAYVDNAGALIADYEYGPFGNITVQSGLKANDFAFRFSTKPLDKDLNIYFYNNGRGYKPETGRWLSRDPIEEYGGVNLYGFVENNPVSKIDPLGYTAYLAYRPLDVDGLRYTSPATGHVYLAFDNKCTGQKWQDELNAHVSDGIEADKKLHTFSFHPWSVKHNGEKNKAGVLVTDGSDVVYRDEVDVKSIENKIASLKEITSKEDDQIRLFRIAVMSWKINSAGGSDIGHYSFLTNNCAHWATAMIRQAGLPIPLTAYFFNGGTAVGGPMDRTGLPQAVYYSAKAAVDVDDFITKREVPSYAKYGPAQYDINQIFR